MKNDKNIWVDKKNKILVAKNHYPKYTFGL